jgi:hypothetical protein
MIVCITRLKMKATKPARIIEPQPMVTAQFYVDVIVQFRGRFGANHPQATGHTKMDDQGAHMGSYKNIFATSSDIRDFAAGEIVRQIYRPPQARLPDVYSKDRFISKEGLYAPPSRFDFGEFRHPLLDLSFLVEHMLTHNRIEFLYFHLVWCVLFVFISRVIVPCTGT